MMDTQDYYVAPYTLLSEVVPMDPLDASILIYKRKLNHWFLDVAKALKVNPAANEGGPGADPVALMVAMSLFEPHGVYLQGKNTPLQPVKKSQAGKKQGDPLSQKNFEVGILRFFAQKHPEWTNTQQELLAKYFYKQIRCGLFHLGTTKIGVWYFRGTAETPSPSIEATFTNSDVSRVIVNVPALILELDSYFNDYLYELDSNGSKLRILFQEGTDIINSSVSP